MSKRAIELTLTDVGRAALIEAAAQGRDVRLEAMAFGSGQALLGKAAEALGSEHERQPLFSAIQIAPGQFTVSAQFPSRELQLPYAVTELALIADGVVFCVWSTSDPAKTITMRTPGTSFVTTIALPTAMLPSQNIGVAIQPLEATMDAVIEAIIDKVGGVSQDAGNLLDTGNDGKPYLSGISYDALTYTPAWSGAAPLPLVPKVQQIEIAAEDFHPTLVGMAALNAAIEKVAELGGGIARFHTPFQAEEEGILRSCVIVAGNGSHPGECITVAPGLDLAAVFTTPDFESQYAAQPITSADGVVYAAGLIDLMIDGNQANVPAVTNWMRGMGVRAYWSSPCIDNVKIINVPGIGMYTTKAEGSYANFPKRLAQDAKRGFIRGLNIEGCGYENYIFEGVTDVPIVSAYGGWASGSLWNPNYRGLKSLRFQTGGVIAVQMQSRGQGYTQASVTATGDGTGAAFTARIGSDGGVDVVLLIEGQDYSWCKLDISGDGSGAVCAAFPDTFVHGMVFNDKATEAGILHFYNNANGYGVRVRNSGSGFPRFKAEFLMGETSWGGVSIGGHARYQVGRVDVHNAGAGGGPPILPALAVLSDRGGSVLSVEDHREDGNNGCASVFVAGTNNTVSNIYILGAGKPGDGIVLTGIQNSVQGQVSGITGAALRTEAGISACKAQIVSAYNQFAWVNSASGNHLGSIIDVVNRSVSSAQFSGIDSLSSRQWQMCRITNTDQWGLILGGPDVRYATADCTVTTSQALTIDHNSMRTLTAEDVILTVTENSGARMTLESIAFVSSTPPVFHPDSGATRGTLTISVKFASVGTGTATVRANIL